MRTSEVVTRPREQLRSVVRSRFGDALFLALIVGLSAIPYVVGLGFYSDDWAFLAVMSTTADQSLLGLIRGQFEADPGSLGMRPTQIVLQAILYRVFGLEPLGYHLVNLAVLMAAAVFLYLVLRRLRAPRTLAVAIPAVYALMPNHATNRFWFASFGYILGMALYLLGLYGDLRAASGTRARTVWAWKGLALAALALAAFGYEVVLPFFLLNIVLAEVVARRRPDRGFRSILGRQGIALLHGSTIAVAAVAVGYKASVALGVGIGTSPIRHALRLAAIALVPNLGTYGAALPHTVGWSIPPAGVLEIAVAVVIGISIYAYLGVLRRNPDDVHHEPTRRDWFRLAALGMGILALGYAIFLTTGRIGFSSTGIANRVAAAGALGSSIVLVAALGWAGSWLRDTVWRDRVLRGGVAALCASGVIIVSALGSFWTQSWDAQREVLADVHTTFPTLPEGSTVLLAGVCPYIGPAIVFESSWDFRGAIRLHHHDPTLEGDVTSGNVWVEPRGVVTRIYTAEVVHSFGDDLILYDRRTDATEVLRDESEAHEVLPTGTTDHCPEGRPGAGAVILPLDRLVYALEGRLGW